MHENTNTPETTPSDIWAEHAAAIALRYEEGLISTSTTTSEVGPEGEGIFSIEKMSTAITDPAKNNQIVSVYSTIRKTYFAIEDTRDVMVSTITVCDEPIEAHEHFEEITNSYDPHHDALARESVRVVTAEDGTRYLRIIEELHELHRGS